MCLTLQRALGGPFVQMRLFSPLNWLKSNISCYSWSESSVCLCDIICYLVPKGGLSDSELQGVADDVQKAGKLADLADSLETVLLMKSLEGDVDAPCKLLQRWRRVENTSEARSLLVYHLRCIELTHTSDK